MRQRCELDCSQLRPDEQNVSHCADPGYCSDQPATLYAGTLGSGVFKSSDGGHNWNDSGMAGSFTFVLPIDPANPAILYTGTSDGAFKS